MTKHYLTVVVCVTAVVTGIPAPAVCRLLRLGCPQPTPDLPWIQLLNLGLQLLLRPLHQHSVSKSHVLTGRNVLQNKTQSFCGCMWHVKFGEQQQCSAPRPDSGDPTGVSYTSSGK